jgi:very-short-patch-repair endonuclease
VVVVGDPDQISPDEIGVPRTAVEQLKQRYVSDVATRDAIEPDTSYFGLATVLCRNVIRLREHFRCMPEIIRFSNDLCYATNPLIPLKQHGAGRLEPPVIARHVPDGCLEGEGQRTTNLPEAQAVVDQIVKCLGDEAYANKTLGVISLLGHSQSRLIDRLLKSRVDAEGIQKRQLICGEPYAFQGDERDVIFLSMVSAVSEGRRIGPLSNDRYKRAFNVAASRAKEQMWLFHSVTLNDLSQTCYRYRLLQFFLGDAARPAPGPMPDEKLRDLAVLAQSTARNGEDAPEPFDSWFEVDVYLELAKRGYRVLPQFEVADYHIDLMVVGLDRRLAVECDGDACHGPDRLEADLFRQRMLERCGEEFWRVRGSDFYRDRERAVRELLDRLDRMDIVPVQREAELRARRRERQASSVQPTASPFAAHQPEEVPVRQAKPAAPAGFVEYRCWPVKDVPDPRTAPVSEVADALYRIVVAEGPVTDGRAYSLYAKGARLGRVARIARRALDSGLGRLMRLGKVDVYFEEPPRSKKELVIVAKDAPKAVVRTLGGRTLDEVPLSELASVIHGLEQKGYREDAPLFRRVLELYGRVALTHAATARLRAARCLGLDGGPVAPPDADCPLQGHFDL